MNSRPLPRSQNNGQGMINRDIPSFLLALEACTKVVLPQMGNGAITAIVTNMCPPAVVEATIPPSIFLLLSVDLPEEWEESLLGRVFAIRGSGVEGRMKSGVVQRIEIGLEADNIETEVVSLEARN